MTSTESLYQHFLEFPKITTDTRSDVKGSIFFALSGENFNGNHFAEEALQKGAALAVIDDLKFRKGERYFLVDNTLKALQELAVLHRDKFSIPVIGITGSNGKTTTKELIASVLERKYKLTYTKGNLNNHIGVPITLLGINSKTEIAIIEMGANHQGEIDQLCRLSNPKIGIITNIGKAHIEGFGSYKGVIKAKSELYRYIQETNGELIVNADDGLLMELSSGIKRMTYGQKNASITSRLVSTLPTLSFEWNSEDVQYECNSSLYGKYNLYNMMAAIAFGIRFGVEAQQINQAVESYVPSNNRSQQLDTRDNKIILDAYNANPVSMSEAIDSFAEYNPANPWLILGDMFELGDTAFEEHQEIIRLLRKKNFKNVLLVGKEFYRHKNSTDYLCFESTTDTKKYLDQNRISDATILIKGSRGMKMETLLDCL